MRLLLAANNQATRQRNYKKLPSTSFNWVQAATDMHPACPNKKPNHLQNSLLRRTQFWVRKSFSKPASLKRASLVEAHVYGPSLSKHDWDAKGATVAGSAHTQEYLLLHVAMLPIGLHAWCHVLGVPNTRRVQAQIARAKRLLNSCPILPAHRKLPWPGYKQGMRLFTKMLVAHPLVGISRPPEIAPADLMKSAGYMTGSMFIRGHSAGSYAGMVLEKILTEFPDIEVEPS